jgi:hypothetical protein
MDKIGPVVVDEFPIINDLAAHHLEQELHVDLICGARASRDRGPLQEENRLDPEKL